MLGLVETKLPADVEAPSIDGFNVVARRDRLGEGGGGVIIYVGADTRARALIVLVSNRVLKKSLIHIAMTNDDSRLY